MTDGIVLGFGIPGLREIVLVALVALALYGRTGSRLLMTTRHGRMLSPWLNLARARVAEPPKRTPARPNRAGGRLFWALALTASVAVAAWVATRIIVSAGSGTPH